MSGAMTEGRKTLLAIEENIGRVIVGRERTIRLVVAALASGGHVLLEDVPGTGKTMLSKALAASLSLTFGRIQFTPDLLPSDVTGLSVYSPMTGEFTFREGPVFAQILLADEINRATPRTQAGLLECMEERQITADGVTRALPSPFFVIATQNPVETAGTFPLPEAQLDRFMVRLSMGLPGKDEELRIMERFLTGRPLEELRPAAGTKELLAAAEEASRVTVPPAVASYLADLVLATRKRDDLLMGASPRGSLAVLRLARVLALMEGRDFVAPEDIKACAVEALAHRCKPVGGFGGRDSVRIIREILERTPVPTEDFGRVPEEGGEA